MWQRFRRHRAEARTHQATANHPITRNIGSYILGGPRKARWTELRASAIEGRSCVHLPNGASPRNDPDRALMYGRRLHGQVGHFPVSRRLDRTVPMAKWPP